MQMITLIIWLSLFLIIGFIALMATRAFHFRWLLSSFLSTLVAAASFAFLFLFSTGFQPSPVKVQIDSPETNDIFSNNRVRITGTVSPADARVTVAIRSEKDPMWWIHSIVRDKSTENDTGKWSVIGYLGTLESGINENFHIIAIASSDDWLLEILTGRSLKANKPTNHLPPWPPSIPVVVRRVK
jgi:hypothetical protein